MGAVLRQLHVCRFLLDVDPTRKSEPWADMETGIFQGVQGSRSGINNTEFITELESCIIKRKGKKKDKAWNP
jgi:hypothetical protein